MMPDPADQSNVDVTDAALALVGRGWRVLPIKPGDKRPPMNSWQHAASIDERVVRNWFRGLYRDHGLGVATGPDSALWVLDVDVAAGKSGDETLAALERVHGPLPDTVETLTGSGGRHLFFSWPTDGRVPRTTRDRLGPGLDVRGEGGQVLVAPTIHPNGQPYVWTIDRSPDDVELAAAPDWLLALVCDDPYETITSPAYETIDPDSIAEWHERRTDWAGMLTADGWTPHRPHGGEQYWTRPGKEIRDGHSAVLHLPDGPFVIFSTDGSLARFALPEARAASGDAWSYSKFGYYAASKHGGDRSEAARRLRELRTEYERVSPASVEPPTPRDELDALLLDWTAFWAKDHSSEEWLAYPIIPEGRQVALYAPGGEGKSLLTIAIAAAVATGRSVLGEPPAPKRHVLYFDYEMTEADLMERLSSLGYDHDDDWSHLHYALLPALDPLDTKEGAKRVVELAAAVGADLVVIDTMARAVEGDENDADTYRSFYRWTGQGLKAAGRALMRLDHAGKEVGKGQRGSSAKNDDVDVVWQMIRTESGYILTTKKARMGWVPKTVNITLDDGPPLALTVGSGFMWPAGTKEVAEILDELEVAIGCSTRTAQDALKAAGKGRVRKLVVAAVKYRNGERPGTVTAVTKVVPDDRGTTTSPVPSEPLPEPNGQSASDQPGTTREPLGTTTGVTAKVGGGDRQGTAPPPGTGSEPGGEIDDEPWRIL